MKDIERSDAKAEKLILIF